MKPILPSPLCELFRSEIASGQAEVTSNSADIVRLIRKRFPTNASGIVWSAVPDSRSLKRHNGLPVQRDGDRLKRFFIDFVHACTPTPGHLLVFGDGFSDDVIALRPDLIVHHLYDLVSIPQHTFVLTNDGQWCFQYQFTDEAFFGEAVNVE